MDGSQHPEERRAGLTGLHPDEPWAFYGTHLGQVAGVLIRSRLQILWPDLSGSSLLGLGFPLPYLRHTWRSQAVRVIAAVNPSFAVGPWPQHSPNLVTLAEDHALPLPDCSVDRVLLVHALEATDHVGRLMREVWRVLAEDGRIIVVAPNRRGLWAHAERTPFGHGRPFSAGQLERLLPGHMFQCERTEHALFVPPTQMRLVLRGARAWEAVGRRVLPAMSGVVLMEARKHVWSALPTGAVARRRRVVVVAAGEAARSGG